MHIVICCNRFPALSQPFITSEVLGLERRGHRVTVLAESVDRRLFAGLPRGGPSGPVVDLDMKGTPPLSTPFSRLHLLGGALAGLPGFLRRSADPSCYLRPHLRWRGAMAARAYARAGAIPEVDLVHAHMGETALWARSIAIRHRAPLAVTFHGSDATRDPLEFGWSTYRRLLDSRTTTFIAHSPFVAERLRSGLGVIPLRVPLGIDTELFAPPKRSRDLEQAALHPRLAFVGRLIPMKGVRLAIEALALLRNGAAGTQLDATLDIVGEGPEGSSIDAVARALGVAPAVRLRGPKSPEGVAATLREMDLLLVPSLDDFDGRQEAYGLVCLEAHASGIPVVGTYCGGLPSAIGAPEGGRCVPQHSPLAMAGAVRELLSLPHGNDPGAPLRRRILQSHSDDASLDAYERAFAAAMSAGRGPADSGDADWMDEWGGPQHRTVPAAHDSQGSLPAYVTGKAVIQIIRAPSSRVRFDHSVAGSWRTIDRVVGAPSGGSPAPAEVVLDLDGVGRKVLLSDVRFLRGMLRPGGIALIAVDAREAEPADTDRVQAVSGFGRVALLDRLFVPDPGGLSPADGRRRDGPPRSALRPPLRYLLCVL